MKVPLVAETREVEDVQRKQRIKPRSADGSPSPALTDGERSGPAARRHKVRLTKLLQIPPFFSDPTVKFSPFLSSLVPTRA
ncbi:hypothetical protein GN956_G1759 [Arapaima gigas]